MRRTGQKLAKTIALCIVDRPTHNLVTGYMPPELIFEQKPVIPIQQTILSWVAIDWAKEISREELLVVRICQLKRRPKGIEQAATKLEEVQKMNKGHFDQTHQLWPKKIEEGHYVLVYDSYLDNQHLSAWKFAKQWFGPYVVTSVNDNGTYQLTELDGMKVVILVVGKWVNTFKR